MSVLDVLGRWRWWIGAAVVVVGIIAAQQWRERHVAEDIGKYRERAERLARDSAAVAGNIRRTDTLFTRDTIKLRSILNRYVTRRDTILARLTDTVRVREFIAAADTAMAACRAVVSTCEQRVAARDSLLRIVDQQRKADHGLFTAQIARANPRVLPYVEGLIDPVDARTIVARGGIELRLVGRLRIVGAGQYTTTGDHRLRALAGVRVTF